jgi:hypothetical protein
VRISALEYWRLQKTSGSSSRKLSLRVGTYSNATALESLVVAQWDNNSSTWKNSGNTFYAGVAVGVITSNSISEFGAFTLGSRVENQNPLPLAVIDFTANFSSAGTMLNWKTGSNLFADHYEVETSPDGLFFRPAGSVDHHPGIMNYTFAVPDALKTDLYFRLKIINTNGSVSYTNILKRDLSNTCFTIRNYYPILARTEITVDIRADFYQKVQLVILDFSGRIVRLIREDFQPGEQTIRINLEGLARGTYVLQAGSGACMQQGIIFFKQ